MLVVVVVRLMVTVGNSPDSAEGDPDGDGWTDSHSVNWTGIDSSSCG